MKVNPEHYKVILNNSQVRILDIRQKPGDKAPMHSHPNHMDLRWKAALRDLQIQLEPGISRSEAAVQSASRGWFLVPRGTGLQFMHFNNPTAIKQKI